MALLIPLLFFLTVTLAVVGITMLVSRHRWVLDRRIEELGLVARPRQGAARTVGDGGAASASLQRAVTALGKKVPISPAEVGDLHRRLMQAGYRDPAAPVFFTGVRVLSAMLLPLVLLLTVASGMALPRALLLLAAGAGVGYVVPSFALGRQIRRRKTRISDALPDTLDLLVVCVEAGLGLNQALVRVGNEMRMVEPVIAEELNLVNLEIRAGKPRTEALRNLARRTGVDDLQSLVSILLQTDKFGTSVAKTLRTFAEGIRTKRRQKAEEAAAKTTIKMVFPLVFCILPALIVVVLGPGAIQIYHVLVKGRLGA